jgi:SSS family solute:Na+ symporter
VHEFSRRSTRICCQGHERRAPHAAHRHRAENALSCAGDFAGHDRRRAGHDADQGLPAAARGHFRQGLAAAIADIEAATPETTDAAFDKISKDVGLKMGKAKVAAIIKANSVNPIPETELKAELQDAVRDNYYNGVILSLIKRYCPSGLMGLALTALLASFMSGMAGNVTAFNTIWTYDLYQAYIAKNKSDRHYFIVGQATTVIGIILSIFCAYFASHYSNAMNIVQLVFGFVNAPLFATCLLGMFWARATATGAFLGLLGGTLTSALFHALTLATGDVPGIKGGYLDVVQTFPSEMAQNFWLAIFAFCASFILTVVVLLTTKRTNTDEELKGLIYSLTPKLKDDEQHFLLRPAVLGTILLAACVVLNIIFW